jgi:hypothetical protein
MPSKLCKLSELDYTEYGTLLAANEVRQALGVMWSRRGDLVTSRANEVCTRCSFCKFAAEVPKSSELK